MQGRFSSSRIGPLVGVVWLLAACGDGAVEGGGAGDDSSDAGDFGEPAEMDAAVEDGADGDAARDADDDTGDDLAEDAGFDSAADGDLDLGDDIGLDPDIGPDADLSDGGPDPIAPVRFAVIGDFGTGDANAAAVAALVDSWEVDFVVTVGDNNYPDGEASTIDENIGQFYQQYIRPYVGSYGTGSPDVNRFYPTPGNHDWNTGVLTAYTDYFELPNNERYYDFVWGPAHFFMIDSDDFEPDGNDWGSTQADWIEARMAASTAPFQFAVFHHPPYSSGFHGSDGTMQTWPFGQLGIDAVLTGHEHTYERLTIDGVPHVITGLGGQTLRTIDSIIPGSRVQYDADFGATLVEADDRYAIISSVDIGGGLIDRVVIRADGGLQRPAAPIVSRHSSWRYLDDGSDQGAAWRAPSFDDGGWSEGMAPLGYGDGDESTVISFGSNADDKFVTTYFRLDFEVLDPADYAGLQLRVRRDDGAIAYVNGAEVFRTNMPAGPVDFATFAVSTQSGNDEDAFDAIGLPAETLLSGTNVLAFEVHQATADSSDLTFDAELVGRPACDALIPFGASWRYDDAGVLPGEDWAVPSFDDSEWSSGPAPLGYGNGDESTTVSDGGNPDDVYVTTWFRHELAVTGATSYGDLLLSLLVDDGAIVYVNGVEVHRINLPLDDVDEGTLAHWPIGGSRESLFHETIVDPFHLVEGPNVVAVEVHQVAPDSSDIRLDLELCEL